ncbi:MAG: hypothetical protein J0I42_13160 [Bosea sp.]|uniref:hypothetical protein n=1 Tax=Bosea sp. (in: a-proteobacteria) TaxID=1871050 RepID=UPI001AC67C08|nr:hypothetical protein [Bosea sp. (in: a-proteobacteria)]MBN9452890.1 hypothetical protein [Bosea sp. (in: a-proteobacteria)]
MPIHHIHTFLVAPAKNVSAPEPIGGSSLNLSGKMFKLLEAVYDRSERECDIAISFNRDASGAQKNPCRDLLTEYVQNPTLDVGRRIAERLAAHTDKRPRMGLLFLIAGKEGNDHKVIISRFPADSGILAEQNEGKLNVEFLERIFMKSARAYKAVLYRNSSITSGFWQGFAIDKQMNEPDVDVSGYWIRDFLDSDFRTTGAAGTRRLAAACRVAARKVQNVDLKTEIAAAVTLAKGQRGQSTSVREFAARLGLSKGAQDAIFAEIQPHLLDEKFQFDAEEFGRQVAYRSIELDNGGILTAELSEFDSVFKSEATDKRGQTIRYTTEGKVIDDKIGKSLR